MKITASGRVALVAWWMCIGVLAVRADMLYLRDGRRVEGLLVAVRGDSVEFEEQRGWSGSRLVRFNRDEVRRIEFDDNGRSADRYDRDGQPGDEEDRPSGLREREVVVSADVAWLDTGVQVRGGQQVYFNAVGRVNWGPGRRDGPEGEKNSPHNANRPMPTRPAAALIGRVGDGSTDYFFIGDEKGPIRMRSNGRLYLGVNDDYLRDNSGNFRVVISY